MKLLKKPLLLALVCLFSWSLLSVAYANSFSLSGVSVPQPYQLNAYSSMQDIERRIEELQLFLTAVSNYSTGVAEVTTIYRKFLKQVANADGECLVIKRQCRSDSDDFTCRMASSCKHLVATQKRLGLAYAQELNQISATATTLLKRAGVTTYQVKTLRYIAKSMGLDKILRPKIDRLRNDGIRYKRQR